MKNLEHYRGGSAPGGRVKEFFAWLRGLWQPKYVPQKSRYGDRWGKMTIPESDLDAQPSDSGWPARG